MTTGASLILFLCRPVTPPPYGVLAS